MKAEGISVCQFHIIPTMLWEERVFPYLDVALRTWHSRVAGAAWIPTQPLILTKHYPDIASPGQPPGNPVLWRRSLHFLKKFPRGPSFLSKERDVVSFCAHVQEIPSWWFVWTRLLQGSKDFPRMSVNEQRKCRFLPKPHPRFLSPDSWVISKVPALGRWVTASFLWNPHRFVPWALKTVPRWNSALRKADGDPTILPSWRVGGMLVK